MSRSVFSDETTSGNNILNSLTSTLNNDPFGILDESGSTVSICGIMNRLKNSPESTSNQSIVTIEFGGPTSSTHTIDDHQCESPTTCLPWRVVKTIEASKLDVEIDSLKKNQTWELVT